MPDPRGFAPAADVELDLSECEREPIHAPGAIQPHGALLVVRDDASREVVQASANVEDVLGRPLDRVLGARVDALLDLHGREAIDRVLRVAAPRRVSAGPAAVGGRRWEVVVHRRDGLLVVELEPFPARGRGKTTTELAALHALSEQILAAPSAAALHALLPAPIRRLTGYERAMVYLFDDNGDGTVVAEDRDPALEPYLGLRYPATDIPSQARRLYVVETTRLIVDARYDPVPLVPTSRPDTGAPLDLGRAVLRSVSPYHCEYLANMGVRGAMSISLVDGDRLIGLIACHHRAPHFVSYRLREECEWLGRIASFVHVTRTREQTSRAVERASRTVHRLVEQMAPDDDVVRGLTGATTTVLDLIDATGAIVRFGGRTAVVGATPPAAFVDGLLAWLAGAMPEGRYATASLASAYAPAGAHLDTACGLLAVQIGATEDVVAWLRPEVARTVVWAGNPDRPAERDELGQLGPRRSFARWHQQVRGHAVAFEPWHLEAADRLRRLLVGVVLDRAAELDRLNRELRAALAARDEFLSIASHELKTPLSTLLLSIEGVASQAAGGAHEPRLARRLDSARRQIVRLDQLVSTLLDVSRIHSGRLDLQLRDDDLAATLRDVVDRSATPGAAVQLASPPSIPARFDRLRIDQVATNLITNAIKYAGDQPIEVVATSRDGRVRFEVRDHGPGIPPELRDALFERFARARDVSNVEGLGLGLWITRAIVRAHAGTVQVEETPCGGTTVVVELPRCGPDRAPGACDDAPRPEVQP